MSLIHSLISSLDKRFDFDSASAHCDIPCKIYDPQVAQIQALSIVRMLDLIAEIDASQPLSLADQAKLSRLMAEKEEAGRKLKEEVRIIWGDYFKAPQFEQFPDTHALVHNIMLEASKAKQHIDRSHGENLVALVNDFAERFWVTKGVSVYRANAPYPPALEVVYPDLKG